jgi:hypothetical protein
MISNASDDERSRFICRVRIDALPAGLSMPELSSGVPA